MKIIYIDESGDTTPISQDGSEFFVLTACIIDESDRQKIEENLRKIKWKFYGDKDVEFKSNYIRYANPDIPDKESPLKLHDRAQYNLLEETLADLMKKIPVVLVSSVIDKSFFWKKYPAQNPYDTAYMFLLERIQKHLMDTNNSLGIVIIDPREGRVEKKFIGDNLERLHHGMRFGKTGIWYQQTPNIVERLLYSDSQNTIGIQLADLYCYAIYHIFEYKKLPNEYWRYCDVTALKLRRVEGKLLGYGLKLFTETTKNGLE
ncbi:MAG: DUF3800 domain-containing protein [Patescibacteria group bacterium]|mgnify:CR=1 FL=1